MNAFEDIFSRPSQNNAVRSWTIKNKEQRGSARTRRWAEMSFMVREKLSLFYNTKAESPLRWQKQLVGLFISHIYFVLPCTMSASVKVCVSMVQSVFPSNLMLLPLSTVTKATMLAHRGKKTFMFLLLPFYSLNFFPLSCNRQRIIGHLFSV